MKKKVLWICPKWLLPAQDGQRVASLNLLRQITKDCDVSLLSFCLPDDIPDITLLKKETGVQEVIAIPISSRKINLSWILLFLAGSLKLTKLPITLFRFTRRSAQAQAQAWIEKNGVWDCVVFDTVHSAGLFYQHNSFFFPKSLGKIFIRAHNVEYELWEMTAKKTRFPLFYSQAKLMKEYERELLRIAEYSFTVSEEDKAKLQLLAPDATFEVLPIGLPFPEAVPESKSENTLLFLGKLDWPPNRDGLTWFLTKVWPKVQAMKPELKLLVAGSGDSHWLQTLLPLRGVNFLGKVPEVNEVYAKSNAMIVPIFYGSGTRVKAIEAARFGLATISTRLGVQGLELQNQESVQLAETEDEWIQALISFDSASAKQLGSNAFYALKNRFAEQSVAQILLRKIKV